MEVSTFLDPFRLMADVVRRQGVISYDRVSISKTGDMSGFVKLSFLET